MTGLFSPQIVHSDGTVRDAEAGTAPARLFHGTGIYCLAAIAHSDQLIDGGHWGKPGEPHGPRTSRDFEIAAGFIGYNVHWGEGGVLVLDRAALNQDYQTVPYRDSCYTGEQMPDEQEEAIITAAVVDLHKYIVSIVCDPAIIQAARDPEMMRWAMAECGWPFHDDEGTGFAEAKAALDALSQHAKLNAWAPESGYPYMNNWDLSDYGSSAPRRLHSAPG